MKKPVFWKASQPQTQAVDPPPSSTVPDWIMILGCIVFLIFSIYMWFALSGSWLYYILFFIPNYVCGEYLGGIIFSEESGQSISSSSFSIMRILFGVVFVFLFFGLLYGIVFLIRWLI